MLPDPSADNDKLEVNPGLGSRDTPAEVELGDLNKSGIANHPNGNGSRQVTETKVHPTNEVDQTSGKNKAEATSKDEDAKKAADKAKL